MIFCRCAGGRSRQPRCTGPAWALWTFWSFLLLRVTLAQVNNDVCMSGLIYGLTVWMLLPPVLLHRYLSAATVLLLVPRRTGSGFWVESLAP